MRMVAFVVFIGAWMVCAPRPALAVTLIKCVVATTCAGGATNCRSEQHCWPIFEMSPGPIYLSGPIRGKSGVTIPVQPTDTDGNGAMDCWKNATRNASISSGFPYRNNGTTPHQGVDIVSGSPNYGRGAPVYSLGAGYVADVGASQANGNFVRVDQGDGNTVTYIHLLSTSVEDGAQVGVSTKIGEMNCTGYCGGSQGSPEQGKINHTHVHIQVKRTDDPASFLDAIDAYGGESCVAAASPPEPPPPVEPCYPTPELRNKLQPNRQIQHCLWSGESR